MPLMKYRISVTLEFLREMKHLSKRYKSLKEDLRNFGNDLLLNPEQGVSLGNNLRKIRIAITSKNKGKSGGARVITYTIIWTEIVGNILPRCFYRGFKRGFKLKLLLVNSLL